jgi:hypothetical protein
LFALTFYRAPHLVFAHVWDEEGLESLTHREPSHPGRSTAGLRASALAHPGRRGRGRRRDEGSNVNGNGHDNAPLTTRRFLSLIARAFVPDRILEVYRDYERRRDLPATAVALVRRDARWELNDDPGHETAVASALNWLRHAQDNSATADGGIARHFSLIDGWSASYPETTGYIAPTLLAEAERARSDELHARARRLLDWLSSIQLPSGAFQAGLITTRPVVPVTFNTGQILIGLADGTQRFGEPRYAAAMHRAASWLMETQEPDGAWRGFPTPLALPGDKTYETHVSWGLFEAERVAPGCGYGDAGLKQVRWALTKQQSNGWFSDCCLDVPATPLTHTIGYALRGIIEAYRLSGDKVFLEAATRTGSALVQCLEPDGRLPGRLDSSWRPAVRWVCLTGSAQIASCWLELLRWTSDERYLDAARRANRFMRRTQMLDAAEGIAGGMRGAFPVSGGYGRYEFLSWAAKFFIDATREEQAIV